MGRVVVSRHSERRVEPMRQLTNTHQYSPWRRSVKGIVEVSCILIVAVKKSRTDASTYQYSPTLTVKKQSRCEEPSR